MILDPVAPLWLLVALGAVLVAFAAWRLVRSRAGRERLGWVLRIVAVILLLVVAARPVIPAESVQRARTSGGLEVYIAVDTTSSMAAEDWDDASPRLDGVKADIEQIASSLEGAGFSLVTFDAEAIQRVPLTSDASALLSASEVLSQEITYYSRGSSIDEPVTLLGDVLAEAEGENPGQERVLFYLGDGEQTAATEPGSFDSLAPFISGGAVLGYGTSQGARMREFTGFAEPAVPDPTAPDPTAPDPTAPDPTAPEPAAPGPADDSPYIQDYGSGTPTDAVSRIDEGNLGAIADELGVSYVHRDADTSLSSVLAGFDVGDVSVSEGDSGTRTELYWIAAIPLGLLALLELVALSSALAEARAAIRRPRAEGGR
jgi:Ca-activated chloride channel family protein